jgi:sodium/proline symporter
MGIGEPVTGVVLATLVIYKIVLIAIGVWAARLNKSESDFFLGGRGLGPWVAGLSYAASTSSAWVLLGFSGFVYAFGVSALWMVPGTWLGYVGVWLWFGSRLRIETAEQGHVTASDFMAAKAGPVWKPAISMLAGFLVLFTFVFYIAAQFGAAAIAFESQFALSRTESVIIGAAVILIYGLLGGFWAVSLTDTLQGAIMALIAVLVPVLAVIAAGGPAGIVITVVFYIFGQMEAAALTGLPATLANLAAIPGDPFERIAPWLAPLILLFAFRQSAVRAPSAAQEPTP